MKYEEALNYLFSKLPMYQRTGASAYKKDIGNIVTACEMLENPHDKFKSIHIAGTNGKGSTAHMLSSIFQEAGYKIGLYTSPHLKDFRERIKINGIPISKAKTLNFILKNKIKFEKIEMSFFEYTVAMAFDYFAEENVDLAIIETGLGGRLDSTNIINPEISIITNIGYDHTNLLGNSLEEIAKEKAGIIKKNVPVIIGRTQIEIKEIFQSIAKEKNSHIYFCNKTTNKTTDLKGEYQIENLNTVLKTISVLNLKIDDEIINMGLNNVVKNTGLQGRWQTISKNPLTICDTGHNEDGIINNVIQLKKLKYNKLHFVFGTVSDKDFKKILKLLPKDATYYFCSANIERSLDSKKLIKEAREHQLLGKEYDSVIKAYNSAKLKAKINDLIFIGGSTFVVAEVL
jgi:dihydrofolate synthase/folylpolyglutamate synthase